jgi:hypothetical protein
MRPVAQDNRHDTPRLAGETVPGFAPLGAWVLINERWYDAFERVGIWRPLGQNSLLRLYGSQISRSEPEKDFINNICHNAT